MRKNGGGHALLSVLLLLSLTVVVAPALATSPVPNPQRDLVQNTAGGKVVVVHVVNATPYDMKLDQWDVIPAASATSQTANKLDTGFVFYPNGVPHAIPARQGASFPTAWMDGKEVFLTAQLHYTLKGVECTDFVDCQGKTKDVPLLLTFTRMPPDKVPVIKDIIKDAIGMLIDVVKLAILPATQVRMGSWFTLMSGIGGFLSGGGSFHESVAELANMKDQLAFSAYALKSDPEVFPGGRTFPTSDQGSESDTWNAICLIQPYDKIDPIPAELVVLTAYIPEYLSNGSYGVGNAPTIVTMVMTQADWATVYAKYLAAGATAAHRSGTGGQILHKMSDRLKSKSGLQQFSKVVTSMSFAERTVMLDGMKSVRYNKSVTKEQVAILGMVERTLAEGGTVFKKPEPRKK